ncbi:Rab3 GTPase-activating protein non-catalytic subunit, partial [Cladochytrium tenue]
MQRRQADDTPAPAVAIDASAPVHSTTGNPPPPPPEDPPQPNSLTSYATSPSAAAASPAAGASTSPSSTWHAVAATTSPRTRAPPASSLSYSGIIGLGTLVASWPPSSGATQPLPTTRATTVSEQNAQPHQQPLPMPQLQSPPPLQLSAQGSGNSVTASTVVQPPGNRQARDTGIGAGTTSEPTPPPTVLALSPDALHLVVATTTTAAASTVPATTAAQFIDADPYPIAAPAQLVLLVHSRTGPADRFDGAARYVFSTRCFRKTVATEETDEIPLHVHLSAGACDSSSAYAATDEILVLFDNGNVCILDPATFLPNSWSPQALQHSQASAVPTRIVCLRLDSSTTAVVSLGPTQRGWSIDQKSQAYTLAPESALLMMAVRLVASGRAPAMLNFYGVRESSAAGSTSSSPFSISSLVANTSSAVSVFAKSLWGSTAPTSATSPQPPQPTSSISPGLTASGLALSPTSSASAAAVSPAAAYTGHNGKAVGVHDGSTPTSPSQDASALVATPRAASALLSLSDQSRTITQLVLAPPTPMPGGTPLPPTLAASVDALGRIFLLDLAAGHIVRVFKGARHAQVAWLQLRPPAMPTGRATPASDRSLPPPLLLLAVYSPRGLLEVFSARHGERVLARQLRRDLTLLQSYPAASGLAAHLQSSSSSPSPVAPSPPLASCVLVGGDMVVDGLLLAAAVLDRVAEVRALTYANALERAKVRSTRRIVVDPGAPLPFKAA